MRLPVTPELNSAILRQYHANMARYPIIIGEVETFLQNRSEDFSLCLRYLYGHMAAQDVLSQPIARIAGYVEATLEAAAQLEYCASIPGEIFLPYVLYHRVNSECLDDSRGYLMQALLPHVRGKSLEQAALAVNYWCYAHATYTPADDRTLGPLAILRRTLGRCGEESVLAVAALRSVGIPARQCYCPRWSHCDDNHAWVEVWTGDGWHYLGACEPEPVLDRGWFTAAASRAMLVDTKCFYGDALYQTVNRTAGYSPAKTLTVRITEQGLPVPNARVRFQIVNYSRLYTLWEALTDEAGLARFETGPGDLVVYACHDGKAALQKVDLRQQDRITVELGHFPEELDFDLVPPADTSGTVPYADDPSHEALLRRCEAHLATHREAAGHNPEIQAFLTDDPYPQAQKEELLSTLRPKDLVDITRETLADALETANAVRGEYPEEIFRSGILAPRIADEMLLPERQQIRSLFPQGFGHPAEILAWLDANMEILPDAGITNYYPSAHGCLRCRQVPGFAFDMVFVALCRAFRFPVRLDPHTGKAQWWEGSWQSIRLIQPPVALTLEFPRGKKLNYAEHFTLGRWDGNDFVPLAYTGLTLEGHYTFSLEPGSYRLTVTTRQIDGTASVAIRHLELTADTRLKVTPPEDQTDGRLKNIPLVLPEGPMGQWLRRESQDSVLLIFADPGSEPTEHLLREMVDLAEEFRLLPCRILLALPSAEALAHSTVELLCARIPETQTLCVPDPDALAALHLQMQVGDLRLPFVVCLDEEGRGVFADANYRIRLAQTLLDIQKLLAAK